MIEVVGWFEGNVTRTRCSTMSGLDERTKIIYPHSIVGIRYKFSDSQSVHALLSEVQARVCSYNAHPAVGFQQFVFGQREIEFLVIFVDNSISISLQSSLLKPHLLLQEILLRLSAIMSHGSAALSHRYSTSSSPRPFSSRVSHAVHWL